ncbi:MAG: DUF2029 domain-containing protein [Crocinitomicaceae bacterium]|nr:DUF2029 domain-containing protein [Crocinitomicaceae bacterium]
MFDSIKPWIQKHDVRLLDWILAFIFLFILFVEAGNVGDFDIYLQASQDLFKGENIYGKHYHEWFHYYYDILFATVLYPFSFLPLYLANLIWLLFNGFLTILLIRRVWNFVPNCDWSERSKRNLSYLAMFILFFTWQKNMNVGQITLLILYLSIESFYQIRKGNYLIGGALLGLGISIKIMPLVLIPYLFYRGYFKAILVSLGLLVVFTLLPSLWIGLEHWEFLQTERINLINPSNAIHVLDVEERSFHSLTTLMTILFIENARNNFTLEYTRNIADVGIENLKLIILVVRLFFIGLTLYFLDKNIFKPAKSPLRDLYALSYILLIVPLIFPHQQPYAFFFAFPAIFFILYQMKEMRMAGNFPTGFKAYLIYAGLGLIFILLNTHFYLGFLRGIMDHYKFFTYGILLIIPFLMYFRPQKIKLHSVS